ATIFRPSAPLHDGAVIVQEERIAAAACFLPLSMNPVLSTQMGTRHRAGIGITEETDAIAMIVSEETGAISLAVAGKIEHEIAVEQLRERLSGLLKRYVARSTLPTAIANGSEQFPDVESPPRASVSRNIDSGLHSRSGSLDTDLWRWIVKWPTSFAATCSTILASSCFRLSSRWGCGWRLPGILLLRLRYLCRLNFIVFLTILKSHRKAFRKRRFGCAARSDWCGDCVPRTYM